MMDTLNTSHQITSNTASLYLILYFSLIRVKSKFVEVIELKLG